MLDTWAKVKGVEAIGVAVTREKANEMLHGNSIWLIDMYLYFAAYREASWKHPTRKILQKEDLGIQDSELLGVEDSFKAYTIKDVA